MPNRPRKTAYSLLFKRKQFKKLTLDDLFDIIEKTGFRVIEYKKYSYSDYLNKLINKLDIEKEIQEKDAFLYYNDRLKFVFLNEDLSDEDKYIVLSHEIGHIYDEQFLLSETVYSNTKKETFANEFVHYLNRFPVGFRAFNFLHKKPLAGILALTITLSSFAGIAVLNKSHSLNYFSPAVANTVNFKNLSPDMYYITSTGTKYHKSFCKHVKYNPNVQGFHPSDKVLEDYMPCLDCIGEILQ